MQWSKDHPSAAEPRIRHAIGIRLRALVAEIRFWPSSAWYFARALLVRPCQIPSRPSPALLLCLERGPPGENLSVGGEDLSNGGDLSIGEDLSGEDQHRIMNWPVHECRGVWGSACFVIEQHHGATAITAGNPVACCFTAA